jgi:hypothetical protein
MPLPAPRHVVLWLTSWLLGLVGAGLLMMGLGVSVIVGWEWNNPYARGGVVDAALLMLIGAGLVAAGRVLDPAPRNQGRTAQGFDVKTAVPHDTAEHPS